MERLLKILRKKSISTPLLQIPFPLRVDCSLRTAFIIEIRSLLSWNLNKELGQRLKRQNYREKKSRQENHLWSVDPFFSFFFYRKSFITWSFKSRDTRLFMFFYFEVFSENNSIISTSTLSNIEFVRISFLFLFGSRATRLFRSPFCLYHNAHFADHNAHFADRNAHLIDNDAHLIYHYAHFVDHEPCCGAQIHYDGNFG